MTRVCACGCGGSLDGRRASARYFDGACRVRAHRARRTSPRPETRAGADVTVTAPLTIASAVLERAA